MHTKACHVIAAITCIESDDINPVKRAAPALCGALGWGPSTLGAEQLLQVALNSFRLRPPSAVRTSARSGSRPTAVSAEAALGVTFKEGAPSYQGLMSLASEMLTQFFTFLLK